MDMGKLCPLSFIPNALSVSYWVINYLNKVLYILSYEFLSNVGMTSEAGTGDGLKKDPDKNFAIFTGKHLHQSLFFSKVAGLSLQLYQKKRLSADILLYLRTPILQSVCQRLVLLNCISYFYCQYIN